MAIDISKLNERQLTSLIAKKSSFEHELQLFRTLDQLNKAEEEVEKLKRENRVLREAMDVEDGADKEVEAHLPEGRRLVLRLRRAQLRTEAH